jgi:polysaccharide export outer membrane protein
MRFVLASVLITACAALTGCASHAPLLSANDYASPAGAYRLGVGDRVRINIFKEPGLSGEFMVSGNGAIAMPLIGEVPVAGLTAEQASQAIATKLTPNYLENPQVALEVEDFRPYFVLGEVERPGRYPTMEGTTLLGAIATAGGYTYRANTHHIFLRRAGDDTEYEVDPDKTLVVRPGDVIRVGERYF